ncbi:DUF1573 domain-containing protein [Empedobacter brevis]
MKSKLFILGAFALSFAISSCGEKKASDNFTAEETAQQAENVVDPAKAPVLTLAEANHNFGDVQANNKVETYIKFKNDGKSPLVIRDASATCGCTVPEFPSTPIAVGATDSIKVVYTAGNMNGKQQKTVTLVTNTANGHEKFDISANVVGATANDQNAQQAFGQ